MFPKIPANRRHRIVRKKCGKRQSSAEFFSHHSAVPFKDRPSEIGESRSLLAVLIEVAGVEPRQKCLAQRRPLGIDGSIPGGITVASLDHRRLSEYSLERKSMTLR
jgi:hypothetical protein